MNALPAVLAIALVTAALRLLPVLLLGRRGASLPAPLARLLRVMPPAIIGFLVVYSLRSAPVLSYPYFIPEAAGLLAAVILQYWKRNTLLSVACATALHMLLLRII